MKTEQPLRFSPVKDGLRMGYLLEEDCKELFVSGEIDDTWDIEILIPDRERVRRITEKPSTLFNK